MFIDFSYDVHGIPHEINHPHRAIDAQGCYPFQDDRPTGASGETLPFEFVDDLLKHIEEEESI